MILRELKSIESIRVSELTGARKAMKGFASLSCAWTRIVRTICERLIAVIAFAIVIHGRNVKKSNKFGINTICVVVRNHTAKSTVLKRAAFVAFPLSAFSIFAFALLTLSIVVRVGVSVVVLVCGIILASTTIAISSTCSATATTATTTTSIPFAATTLFPFLVFVCGVHKVLRSSLPRNRIVAQARIVKR